MVKVQINETVDKNIISNDFVGLAKDNEGDVWLFGIDFAVSLTYDTALIESSRNMAIKDYGPFTKYNGQVIIEND